NGIETRFGVRADGLDTDNRAVVLADGERIGYDKVLIATGGRNRRGTMPGVDLDGVCDLRTVADADAIRAEMAKASKAVVVGMGFIGAEVAASFRQQGLDVVAIEPFQTPLF